MSMIYEIYFFEYIVFFVPLRTKTSVEEILLQYDKQSVA